MHGSDNHSNPSDPIVQSLSLFNADRFPDLVPASDHWADGVPDSDSAASQLRRDLVHHFYPDQLYPV